MQEHRPVGIPAKLSRPFALVAVVTGGLTVALGLAMVVWWYTYSTTLVQVVPTFALMQYNTALGFLFCGVALLLLPSAQPGWTAACGTGAAVVGLLTLLEYVFGVYFGIDQLLPIPYVTVSTSHPEHMAPNTAVGFLLSGAGLLALRRSAPTPRVLVLSMFLGLAVLVLGAVASLGYLVRMPTAYRWGHLTAMAIHTAVGFVVLGTGVIAYAWGQARADATAATRWLPVLVGVGVIGVALALGLALRAHEHALMQRTVIVKAVGIKAEIAEEITNRILALVRLANLWEVRGQAPPDEWEAEVALSIQHDPSLHAILWVDPAWQVQWIAPRMVHDAALNLHLGGEAQHRHALEQAQSTGVVTVVRAAGLEPGDKALFVYVPLFQNGTFGGVIGGVFGVPTLLNTILDKIAPGLGLAIFDGDEILYSRGQTSRLHTHAWDQEVLLSLAGVTWRMRFWPLSELVATERSALPEGVVTLGFLVAALLALVLHFAQATRRHATQVAQANTALQDEMIERQRAEEHLQRQQEALYQREKLASMGILLASVAHELNNPLSVVMMHADLLREEIEDKSLSEHAIELGQAAERCVRIVRNFLTLARQHRPQRAAVYLNTVVEEVMALLAYAFQVDNVDVCLHLADNLPVLWADPHQLHQVVVNLVTNAQQALRETATPRRLTLTTQVDPTQPLVSLEVADTGPGIPLQVQARIFEPFFTTKPSDIGTGLGLPLCQGIIESHSGTISVTSQPGHGTVFRVELPVEAAPVPVALLSEAPLPIPMQEKTLLVVDDEASIVKAMVSLLHRDRHQVDTAANGRLALAKLQERTYDLILCDLRMPELDGPGLYRELEAQAPHLLRRFVFLTGDTLSPEGDSFLKQTGVPRLVKPCKAVEVRQVVQQALQALETGTDCLGAAVQERLPAAEC